MVFPVRAGLNPIRLLRNERQVSIPRASGAEPEENVADENGC